MLKENPSTFGDTCILAEHIGRLDDFVHKLGGSNHNNGYAPMDLDAANG